MSTRIYQQGVTIRKLILYTQSLFMKESYTYRGLPMHWRLPKRMTPSLEYKLNSYGLLYDDYVWHEKNWQMDVQEALKRIDPEVREMRQRRLDRANDLVHKHITIPEHMFNHQGKPFDPKHMYLTPIMSEIMAEHVANWDMKCKHE